MSLESYRAIIAAIDARILALETAKTEMVDSIAHVDDPQFMSTNFAEDLGRPFDNEINWLRYKRNAESIAFAHTME